MALKKRLVVLASGRGSNFCAISDAINKKIIPNAEIAALISNKRTASVLNEAKLRNIPSLIIESKLFRTSVGFDRQSYEIKLLELLKELKPDLILLAGYMLVLGKTIVNSFPNKILNIHPSLLPKYRGLHAQRQAIENGDTHTGCTVHWVTEGLDEGNPVLQASVPIFPGDTESTLSERLLPVEHKTYIEAVNIVLKKMV